MIWQRKYAEYGKLIRHQFSVTIRSPVAEKLPGIAHFTNHVQVQIGNDESFLIARSLGNDLAAQIRRVRKANPPPVLRNYPVSGRGKTARYCALHESCPGPDRQRREHPDRAEPGQ